MAIESVRQINTRFQEIQKEMEQLVQQIADLMYEHTEFWKQLQKEYEKEYQEAEQLIAKQHKEILENKKATSFRQSMQLFGTKTYEEWSIMKKKMMEKAKSESREYFLTLNFLQQKLKRLEKEKEEILAE